MGRDTKAVGKLGKKRRPKGATAKPRSAPKAERGRWSSGANRESKVARLTRELGEALQRQAATADILKVIASSPTDTQPVFEAIVLTAVRLLRCDMSFVMLCDPPAFWVAAAATPEGLFDELTLIKEPIDPSANFPSRTIVEKRALYLPDWSLIDLPEHERHIHETVGVNSALYLPLMREGECIGLLTLGGKQANIFGESEIALAESFRDQALIAIENARLFNETQDALERQTATADVLKVIASSPTNIQPVFDAIAERSNRLIGGHATAVYRFVGEMVQLEAFTPVSAEADAALKASYPRPIAGEPQFELVREGKVAQIADTDSENVAAITKGTARVRGWRSVIFMPLTGDADVIGAITVTRKEAGAFADHHIRLLQTFADQALIAIENARLFNETKEALEQQTATADILKVISASPGELEPVFEAMLANAVRLCEAKFAMVFLYNDNEFRAVGKWNLPPAYSEFLGKNTIRADPMIPLGRVAITKQPVQIADVLADQSYIERYPGMVGVAELGGARTLLQVPMLKENELVGTIGIYRQEVRPFTDKQIALVQNFAAQAVIAIENARLLNELRQRTDDLTRSLDDLRTAQDRLVQTEKLASLGQLTAGIAHEIKNPLNFVNNFSALSAELIDEMKDVLSDISVDRDKREELDEITQMLKSNLDKVVQHGKRADSIVKNMLLHSRAGSGEHRPVDINAIVDESLNLAYHGARAEKTDFNITMQRNFDPATGMADVYPQEITRVLLNLISNGFYATTKRNAEADDGFKPTLSAATKNLGDKVEIRIRDNGAGIPAEVKEKIFNPFFTTKPAGEGTGLGLSMSHDIIVKQHGGTIDVETEPGLFTEFKIVLPRTSQR
jgi:signal transduction histidine kinase